MSVTIEVDTALHAAYIRLSEEPVSCTVEFSDEIMIDLDKFGVAVGVEVLDEGARLPFEDLVEKYHVRSEVVELLRLIRPDVSSFLEFESRSEGSSSIRPAGELLEV